jgi:ATP-dependent DNA helicase RecQ
MNSPLEVLKKKFGYEAFRLDQEAIIQSVLEKQDTFVLMPTGGGKSLCYQVPALMFDGITLVISPLIALMKDQVDALRVNGVEAAYLNSSQTWQEQQTIISRARENKIKLLYLAPERLIRFEERDGEKSNPSLSQMTQAILAMNVSLIAIDEAHCISHWGHDFRPEYLMLAHLKKALPQVPVIALTATADKLTRKDIVEKLALHNPRVFVSSFNRANIRYTIEDKRNAFDKLVDFLESRKDEAGIVYCLSRASTERIAGDLQDLGFKALPYHAGLDKEERARNQEKFLKDDVKIIVATIAFGMGINKSNVRYVVHMDLPKNIEGYYQETGRAGRDGLDSEALLFYSYGDVLKLKKFIEVDGNEEQTRIAHEKLEEMASYGGLTTCRRKFLLNYFDESAPDHCGNCDVCLTSVDVYDGTVHAQKVLSAVSRLGERYGAGHIVDFMRGSNSVRITEDQKQLKTYGVGSDMSKDQWNEIIRDLVEKGYLEKTRGLYPVLVLTEKSTEVLKGNATVMLTKSRTRAEVKPVNEGQYEKDLLHTLKDVRRRLAAEEDIPPYMILSDASLMEIATYLPFNKPDFRKISGFGEAKIERYGRYFWQAVADYCTEHSLQSRIHLKTMKIRREKVERDSDTKRQSLDMFRSGHEVEKIAVLRNLTVSTVEGHLAFYIQSGQLELQELLEPSDAERIRRAIDASGTTMLSVIRQKLHDEYSFGQIRMVLADMQKRKEVSREMRV